MPLNNEKHPGELLLDRRRYFTIEIDEELRREEEDNEELEKFGKIMVSATHKIRDKTEESKKSKLKKYVIDRKCKLDSCIM